MTISRARLCALASAAALMQTSAASTQTAIAPLPSTIEADARHWLRNAEPFGITGAIAILRDTTVTLLEGYGSLGPQGGRIGPDTPFILASLSKQFTAAAVLKCAADGLLALSDSVGKYFPDTPLPQRNITVEQLLTHTSGLPYLEPHMFDAAPDRAALMRELLALPLEFAPGSKWSYSSPGYAVLAGILERAEHRRFETILVERLFKPAGMVATTFLGHDLPDAPFGAPHGVQLGEDQGPMNTTLGADRAVGNGSVISTARDMARWEVALRNNRVLNAKWTAELFKPRVAAAGGAQFSYGWNVFPTPRGTTLLFHAGDLGSFNTEFRRYVDDKFTLIWLSNARLASGGTRTVVTRMIAGLVNGTPVVMPPSVAGRDLARERAISGDYVLEGGDTLTLYQADGEFQLATSGADGLLALAGGVRDTTGSAKLVSDALTALLRDSPAQFRERLHPSLPPDQAIASVRAFLSTLSDSLGAPARFEAIGAMPSAPGAATVWVRMRGSRNSVALSFGTVGGRIMTFASPTVRVSPFVLRRSSENSAHYVWFDPASSRTVRVTVANSQLTLSVDGSAPVIARGVRASTGGRLDER